MEERKNALYRYKTIVGCFFIRYNSYLDRWDLGMGDEVFGNYHMRRRTL